MIYSIVLFITFLVYVMFLGSGQHNDRCYIAIVGLTTVLAALSLFLVHIH